MHAADLLVAATGDDEDNLVIGLLAKRQFAVPRVMARVNDPDNAWLFDQRWGIDVALPASTPLISLIEEATGATDTVALVRLAKPASPSSRPRSPPSPAPAAVRSPMWRCRPAHLSLPSSATAAP